MTIEATKRCRETRQVRADPLDQVQADDERDDARELFVLREDVVENGLDLRGHTRRRDAVHDHGDRREREASAVRTRVADQSDERIHSVNR